MKQKVIVEYVSSSIANLAQRYVKGAFNSAKRAPDGDIVKSCVW